MVENIEKLSLAEIAYLIYRDWQKINYAAKPYLEAMQSLETIEDNYGFDDGKGIVIRFLGNAGSYRGETAKAIKKELKRRVGIK